MPDKISVETRDQDRGGGAPQRKAMAGQASGPAAWRLVCALAAGAALLPRTILRVPILFYRYTLSAFMGRQCRYLPTCSAYADEAIARHGAWPGSFMAAARICRCNPYGGHGFDPVPKCVPTGGRWYAPWRYGIWRMPVEREEARRSPPSPGVPPAARDVRPPR